MNPGALLALPTSLLVSIAGADGASAQALQWPYNLPRNVKYFPEHEPLMKREAEVQERLTWQAPVGVRKMSHVDEGEKFFLQYWNLGEGLSSTNIWQGTNESLSHPLDAAVAPHRTPKRSIFARDFQCPQDTTSCTNIGSNLCCPNGQTCVSVGNGQIGCCPPGVDCSDSVRSCDTAAGYTSCANSPNGGCCVPGAVCEGTGCVFYGTRTVWAPPSTSTTQSAPSNSSASERVVTTTQIVPAPAPAAVTSVSVREHTITVTDDQKPSTIVSTVTITPTPRSEAAGAASLPYSKGSSTCSTGFVSCASSLGGGCCPSGQRCGSSNLCLSFADATTSSSSGVGAPIRPTSMSSGASLITTTAPGSCPTGYYMCSAYYLGGCCRVGRDCDTTSCPTNERTVVESGNAVVSVPVDSVAAAGGQGRCADGWNLCPQSVGGGCCPSGYACETTCRGTVSGMQGVAKETAASLGVKCHIGWGWGALGVGVLGLMIVYA
ncbi:hypothetical protein K470DRAFT_254278 [Piedraia hortae CBS 480.64]|uniref:GPI anchored protein n=1 Tax=Piedraia hortae CBS 480.64 TaxID=1314780 RepID=A0A6A7CA66_9PEZI|nr:hypothetical protein K470DRAFT_254278 [Piedraia hortae CBS 480.64]